MIGPWGGASKARGGGFDVHHTKAAFDESGSQPGTNEAPASDEQRNRVGSHLLWRLYLSSLVPLATSGS